MKYWKRYVIKMSLLSRFKGKKKEEKRVVKYYLNYLGETTNGKWKTIQEFNSGQHKESLDEITVNPPPGLYKFIAHYEDDTMKVLWNETVGGYVPAPAGRKSKKESPVDKILAKIADQADFSNLQLRELVLPSDGFNLKFVNPNIPQAGSEGGYMIVDGQQIPVGQLPPLEFEGKLPVWMHPAVTATISSLVDKVTKQVTGAFGNAIRNSIGVGKIQPVDESEYEIIDEEKKEIKPEDGYHEFVKEFDEFVAEDEESVKEVEELDEENKELEYNDKEIDKHIVDEAEHQQIQIPSVEGELPEEVISVKDKYDDKDVISTEEI